MANKQLFLNNFETVFIAPVKDTPVTGTPAAELDYGILRISDGAAANLINPTGGDFYVLTALKRSGSTESNIEVMRVTNVDNSIPGECRVTVLRAQEGTTAKAYVSGDYFSLRVTKGAFQNFVDTSDSRLTNSRAPTGAAGGVLSGTYPNPGFAADMATQAEFDAHTGNTSNPHATTKAQVGLGNVDNTTDLAKPVSTATQTALDAKVTGPASSTDNTLPRFDGTTGKLLQGSGVVVDDSNNLGVGRSPNYKVDAYLPGTGSPAVAATNDSVVNILQAVSNTHGNVGTLTSHPLVFSTANTDRGRIDTNGNFLLGGTSITPLAGIAKGIVIGDASNAHSGTAFVSSSATWLAYQNGTMRWFSGGSDRLTLTTGGDLTASGNVTAYSDERLKKDWADVGPGFLPALAQVKRGTYTRIDVNARQAGVSAQSLREVLPEAVLEGDDGTLSVAYGNAALLAVVELAARVLELEVRLKELEGR